MSADLVPGCILLEELASMCDCSISVVASVAAGPPDGEFGPIWISAGGGGLGRRGELGARDMMDEVGRSSLISRASKLEGREREEKRRKGGGNPISSSVAMSVASLAGVQLGVDLSLELRHMG